MNLKVSDAKREEGFTLIELLVVVIIIGILAAIAIPVFLNQRERAWVRTAESDARNIAIEVETFFNDFFTYPTGPATVAALPAGSVQNDFFTHTSGDIPDSGDIVLSPNVGVDFTFGDTAFCIEVTHVLIDDGAAPENVAVYNSATGGIVNNPTDAAACDFPA